MPAGNHPSYMEELERLKYTNDYVDRTFSLTLRKKEKVDSEVERVKKHFNSDSSQNYIDLIINSQLQDTVTLKLKNLAEAKSRPYFARTDFLEEGKTEAEKLYIGKMSLMRDEDQQVIIVDWRAPVANLYYEERLGDACYACPGGDIKGQLFLKRQFSIHGGELKEIFDIDITTNDDFLQSYLGASADNRLKEIVSTIQAEQNRIIRAEMWRPLVVQGAAGSGKTTIALHRIAYLIYTHEKTLQPDNFMIIAPSRFFLDYISEVLPELGVERIAQSTFDAFAMNLLGKKFKVKEANEKLVEFISEDPRNRGNAGMLLDAARIKASMKFKDIMDRYVEYIEESFIPCEDFIFEGFTVYSYGEINRLFLKEYKRWPLVKRIDEIRKHLESRLKLKRESIIENLQEECDKKVAFLKLTIEDEEERRPFIIEAIDGRDEVIAKIDRYSKSAVKEYIKKISKFSPMQYYTDLMEDIVLLKQLSGGTINLDTLEFLADQTSRVIRSGFIEIEDFAPLIYLKYLIYGMDEKIPVRQVIIDEAQDFSVFQLYALKKIIKDSSFTLLGDLNQGIHSYRGVSDWDDVLNDVFGQKVDFLTLEQSYRTTVEIMEAANTIISFLGKGKFQAAKPVIRHGEPVRLFKVAGQAEIYGDIGEKLSLMQEKGYKSMAVICKTPEECRQVQAKLKKILPEVYMITGKEDKYKGGTAVIPSYLSKGLEFDAVFIVDAQNYSTEELDVKLLYVAATRALHNLFIYFTEETPVLKGLNSSVSTF